MSTYRELIYLILDEIKGISDDFYFTEDHVLYLINKYRAFLLKQKYSDVKKYIPESNYQTISLTLNDVPTACCEYNLKDEYKKSNETIPYILNIAIPRVYDCTYMHENISYIPRDRMRFVGYNKYLNNIIYCSVYPNNYLYLKSANEKSELTKVKMTAVFQDALKALELVEDKEVEIIDNVIPLEDSLIQPLVEVIVKELLGAAYRPKDTVNNANDDLSDLATFLRNNVKSNLQKQIEGN